MLTFARIVMIPLCLWFLDQDTPRAGFWSAIVFTLAAITDLLDGYLARKLGVVSVLGKLIDPLADKLIVMATLVWLVPMDRMPAWAVIALLAREFSVTALRSVAASSGVIISAGQEGKTFIGATTPAVAKQDGQAVGRGRLRRRHRKVGGLPRGTADFEWRLR